MRRCRALVTAQPMVLLLSWTASVVPGGPLLPIPGVGFSRAGFCCPFQQPCSPSPVSEATLPLWPSADLPFSLDSRCRISLALWSALLIWDSLVNGYRCAPPDIPSRLSPPATSSEWTS